MKRLIIAVITVAALSLPAVAAAHRRAVKSEAQGMLFHARDYRDGENASEPRSTP